MMWWTPKKYRIWKKVNSHFQCIKPCPNIQNISTMIAFKWSLFLNQSQQCFKLKKGGKIFPQFKRRNNKNIPWGKKIMVLVYYILSLPNWKMSLFFVCSISITMIFHHTFFFSNYRCPWKILAAPKIIVPGQESVIWLQTCNT